MFRRHRSPLFLCGKVQVNDVRLLIPLHFLPPEEENQRGDGHEPDNTSNHPTNDGANVGRRSTITAPLITAFIGGICDSWRGVCSGGCGRGSGFWVSPNSLRGCRIEFVLFLIRWVQMCEQ